MIVGNENHTGEGRALAQTIQALGTFKTLSVKEMRTGTKWLKARVSYKQAGLLQ